MAKNKVKVITNMGAANPVSAAERTCEIARKLGVCGLKIACVTGDDITDELDKPVVGIGFDRRSWVREEFSARPRSRALHRR